MPAKSCRPPVSGGEGGDRCQAQAILGDGRVTAVKTEAGTLPADVVVVSAGIRPNTAFLEGSGLEMVKGTIPVDGASCAQTCRTYTPPATALW